MQTELNDYLTVLEEVLPIGPEDWEVVTRAHNNNYPYTYRTKDNLKRKFNFCLKQVGPTGNPDCPDWVIKAKKIKKTFSTKHWLSV